VQICALLVAKADAEACTLFLTIRALFALAHTSRRFLETLGATVAHALDLHASDTVRLIVVVVDIRILSLFALIVAQARDFFLTVRTLVARAHSLTEVCSN
jgi:hypothetical protein